MTNTVEKLEKLVQDQYSLHPYPSSPVEEAIVDSGILYNHSLVNAYYLRNRKVINTEGKRILDVGCGTGFKTMALALANPGAAVTGIDISEKSINIAVERINHHGIKDVKFVPTSIDNLSSLNQKFDYINCDDTLYLYSDISAGLRILKSVLATDGIIRANLHSALQRRPFLCSQEVFKLMGLMDTNPDNKEIQTVHDFMVGLDDNVINKVLTWSPAQAGDKFYYLMNYLIQADQGYDTNDLFQFLSQCDLELATMVNWAEWDVIGLFPEYGALPDNIRNFIDNLSGQKALRVFELLNPIHRLLDFWCGHKDETHSYREVSDWSVKDWYGATINLQPQLRTSGLKAKIESCAANGRPLEITLPFAVPQSPLFVDSTTAAWILLLWNKPQRFEVMVDWWCKLKPINPLSFLPIDKVSAQKAVIETLTGLESLSYVLIEKSFLNFQI